MTRLALPLLLAALLASASEAHAQNFFERLFGLTPSRPQQPAYAPPPERGPPPPEMPFDDAPRRTAPAAPAVARPIAVRTPNEDNILGRDLKQNGSNGSLKLERSGRADMRLKMSLVGRRSPQSVETCTIPLSGPEGAALVSLGKPEGVSRYQLQDPTCPLTIDILDDAVLVKGPSEICVFQSAACQADPSGLWGPEPAQLMGRVRDFEQTRGSTDKAVRENYKVLAQRARPENVRPIIAEQAAFSAERETVCRSYAREGTTSFCNAKYTEARALSLAARLGIGTSTASAEARPRRSRQPADPYSLPASDEIMQRRPEGED